MAKKEFTYRGKTLDELKAMSLKELADLFPASQRRKITRGFSEAEKKLIEKVAAKNNVKTHLRDMIILPGMVGKTIRIHSGKEFLPREIQPDMIGHRLGELVLTRKKVGHTSPGVGATKASGKVSVR